MPLFPKINVQALALDYNEFGFRLLRHLAKEERDNLCLSPHSIAMALALAFNAADGETRRQLGALLSATSPNVEAFNKNNAALYAALKRDNEAVRIFLANSLWLKDDLPFHAEFLQTGREFFEARIQSLNFQAPNACGIMNRWVSEATHGLINSIIEPPLSPLLVMVLLNAIYFKGTWSDAFDPELSSDGTFYSENGPRRVRFMEKEGRFFHAADTDFEAIAVPYGDGKTTFWAILPDKGYSLDSLLQRLHAKNLRTILAGADFATGLVRLPRFKFESDLQLIPALQSLGAHLPFDENRADFSLLAPITQIDPIYISEVRHRAVIEVNEQGTEAAAITEAEFSLRGLSEPSLPFNFIANRPFLAIIEDSESGSILFLCRVMQP